MDSHPRVALRQALTYVATIEVTTSRLEVARGLPQLRVMGMTILAIDLLLFLVGRLDSFQRHRSMYQGKPTLNLNNQIFSPRLRTPRLRTPRLRNPKALLLLVILLRALIPWIIHQLPIHQLRIHYESMNLVSLTLLNKHKLATHASAPPILPRWRVIQRAFPDKTRSAEQDCRIQGYSMIASKTITDLRTRSDG